MYLFLSDKYFHAIKELNYYGYNIYLLRVVNKI